MFRSVLHSCVSAVLLAGSAVASTFTTVWQLGNDDASLSPFSQESFGPNNAPGSASLKDDDFYLAGTYPFPVGVVAADESIAFFERAVTLGDPRNRIHFPLNAAQASAASLLRITIDLTGGGAYPNLCPTQDPDRLHTHDCWGQCGGA